MDPVFRAADDLIRARYGAEGQALSPSADEIYEVMREIDRSTRPPGSKPVAPAAR